MGRMERGVRKEGKKVFQLFCWLVPAHSAASSLLSLSCSVLSLKTSLIRAVVHHLDSLNHVIKLVSAALCDPA